MSLLFALRPHALPLALLSGLWLIPVLLVGTQGDFPLSDDFAYHFAVVNWLETGEFQRLAWTFVPLYTNAVIGVVFAGALGADFESLRISTLCFAWVAIVGTYALAHALHAPRRMALLAAGLLAINPLFVNLSFTFMTDVVFTALVVWSLAASVRGLEQRDPRYLAAALALMVAAIFSRQTGIALFGAMAFALLPIATHLQRLALGGLVVAIAVLVIYYGDEIGFRSEFLVRVLREPHAVGFALIRGLGFFPSYLGAFLFPIACLAWWKGPRRLMLASAIGWIAIGSIAMVIAGRSYPPGINVIFDLGLGSIELMGANALPKAHPALWPSVTIAGLASFGIITVFAWTAVAGRFRAGRTPVPWLALVGFVALLLGVHSTRTPFFDRHLLPAVGVLAAALVSLFPRDRDTLAPRTAAALTIATCVPIALFSWLGTRDYLEHHRARSAVTQELFAKGATAKTIDAGIEFQGWKNYSPGWRALGERRWVDSSEYLVCLDEYFPGYEIVTSRDYYSWLAGREITIFGLHEVGF